VYGEIAEEDLAKAEIFGLPTALLILVVVFGALVAAGVPLLVAITSIAVSMGLSTILGQMYPLSEIVMNIIVMIGLAVGIDYALFIVERYREERRHGASKHQAIEIAGGTATKAVVFSGMTVVIALAGMFIIPISVFRSLGIGAMIAVVVSVAASMTMIPAMLALLGDKIDWPRRRKYDQLTAEQIAANRFHDDTIHGGFWGRITKTVMARPVISAVLAIGLLVAASLPYLDLKTGQTGIAAGLRGQDRLRDPEREVLRRYPGTGRDRHRRRRQQRRGPAGRQRARGRTRRGPRVRSGHDRGQRSR
jgi:RND superfamily putative drug exporter